MEVSEHHPCVFGFTTKKMKTSIGSCYYWPDDRGFEVPFPAEKKTRGKQDYASPFCGAVKNTWTKTSRPYTPSWRAGTHLYSVISRCVVPFIGPTDENPE